MWLTYQKNSMSPTFNITDLKNYCHIPPEEIDQQLRSIAPKKGALDAEHYNHYLNQEVSQFFLGSEQNQIQEQAQEWLEWLESVCSISEKLSPISWVCPRTTV